MEGLFETEVKLEGLRNKQLLLDAEADELQRHVKHLAEEHPFNRCFIKEMEESRRPQPRTSVPVVFGRLVLDGTADHH